MRQPYIAINSTDGKLLGLSSGQTTTVSAGETVQELVVVLRSDVPKGVALIPLGMTGINSFSPLVRGRPAGARASDYGVART